MFRIIYNKLRISVERILFSIFLKILKKFQPKTAGKLIFNFSKFSFKKIEKDKKTVFAISAAAFLKDIKELQSLDSINLIYCDQYWPSIILLLYFPKGHRYLNHFYGLNIEIDEKLEVIIKNVKLCFDSYIKEFTKKYGKIDWFLFPSFDQGGVKIFTQYANENCIKVASFYYEHYTMPITKLVYYNHYKEYNSTSPGGKLLLWHSYAKDNLLKNGFAKSDDMIVSGPPRLNRWLELLDKDIESKYITLLSFPGAEYWAPFTYTDILYFYKDLAEKYPEYTFIVKCKDQWHVDQSYQALANEIGLLQIRWDIDMIEVLSQSKVITGFNSLSFIEALLSKAYLLCPYWGDSKHDPYLLQMDPQNELVQEVVEVIDSRHSFLSRLEFLINAQPCKADMSSRLSLLNEYFYFDPKNPSIKIFENLFLSK